MKKYWCMLSLVGFPDATAMQWVRALCDRVYEATVGDLRQAVGEITDEFYKIRLVGRLKTIEKGMPASRAELSTLIRPLKIGNCLNEPLYPLTSLKDALNGYYNTQLPVRYGTLLQVAIEQNLPHTVAWLLENGAQVKKPDEEGYSAVEIAMYMCAVTLTARQEEFKPRAYILQKVEQRACQE